MLSKHMGFTHAYILKDLHMDGYVCRIKFTFETFSKNLKVQRGYFRAGASRMDASALNLSILLVMKSTAQVGHASQSSVTLALLEFLPHTAANLCKAQI